LPGVPADALDRRASRRLARRPPADGPRRGLERPPLRRAGRPAGGLIPQGRRGAWRPAQDPGQGATMGPGRRRRSDAPFGRPPGGALRQLGGRRGCIDYRVVVPEPRADATCARGKLLWPTSAALSRDGRNLYVASWAFDPHGDRSDNYSDLAVFARDRTTGALRQLPGRQGCLGPSARGGCAVGRALSGPESVVVSP